MKKTPRGLVKPQQVSLEDLEEYYARVEESGVQQKKSSSKKAQRTGSRLRKRSGSKSQGPRSEARSNPSWSTYAAGGLTITAVTLALWRVTQKSKLKKQLEGSAQIALGVQTGAYTWEDVYREAEAALPFFAMTSAEMAYERVTRVLASQVSGDGLFPDAIVPGSGSSGVAPSGTPGAAESSYYDQAVSWVKSWF